MAIKSPIKKMNAERLEEAYQLQSKIMKKIYSNKNSDEYKMHGDITKSSQYATMEKLIADLFTLKHFPSSEAKDIKTMFMTLHRPIWKKMVTEYIAKPDDKNTIYTVYFSMGYRILRGELARIYASTEATEKGVVYKFDKIARKEWIMRYIKYYNDKLEQMIDEAIQLYRKNTKPLTAVQEAEGSVVGDIVHVISLGATVIGNIFRTAAELNPISFISAILSRSYDKKVEKYEDVVALYLATKEAYDEYMKIPEKDRDKKIESNYVKNIEKYNIKMGNLKAKIDHFDSRALEEAKDREKGLAIDGDEDLNDSKKDDSDKKKESPEKENDKNDEPSSSSDDNDGFDF